MGRAQGAPAPSDNHGGSQPIQKRLLDNPEVVANRCFERSESSRRGRDRGRGNREGRGRTSPNSGNIDFNAIVGGLITPQER
jgi:hypothetical protein